MIPFRVLLTSCLISLPFASGTILLSMPAAGATNAMAVQTDDTLSLSEAVDAALRNHPATRSARLTVELAEKRVQEARAGRMPALRLSETVTRGNNPVFVFGSLLEQSRFGPANFELPALNNPESITNLRTSLAASVPVFDGMRSSARIDQAGVGRRQAALEAASVEQRIRFQIVQDYFGVLVARERLRVAAEAVSMAEAQVARAQNLLDAGLGARSDLLTAEVQLADYRQQLIAATGDLETAFVTLNVGVGALPQSRPVLGGALVPRAFDVAPPEELTSQALLTRTDYLNAESAIELAEHRLSERRGEYLPEVNAFASLDVSGRNITTGSMDYTVGAGLTFSLFDAGRSARADQARIETDMARIERDRVRDRIRVDVSRTYNDYRSVVGQLGLAEASRLQAAEALRITQDRYEVGLATMTEVLGGGTALVRAEMNVANSIFNLYLSYANVLLASGQLDDVAAFGP